MIRTARILFAALLGLAVALPPAGYAEDPAVAVKKALDLADRAAALVAEKGEAALPILSAKDGGYIDGEYYAFVMDFSGTLKAHAVPGLIGKNLIAMKDPKGDIFAADFVNIAKSAEGKGWKQYWWPKPGAKEASQKVTFIKRVPGQELLVGVGIYDLTKDDAERLSK